MTAASIPIRGLCSMATRGLLDELAARHAARSGVPVSFLAVGGVEAVRRVRAGEPFDVVALAADALEQLVAEGRVDAAGRSARLRRCRTSPAALALPDAVLAVSRIGDSIGPSGAPVWPSTCATCAR